MGSYGFCMDYTGGKRRVYLRAREMVKLYGFEKRFANISMFVKPDKYYHDDVANKAPRAIQFRSPMYNILVGCYLKPFEHAIYATELLGARIIAKGLNNVDRARNIVQASQLFANPLYLLVDHSKFDSHIRTEMLKELHKLYVKQAGDEYLRYLLSFSIVNKGYTKAGIRYSVNGTRMSGDYDTGLGNTIINIAVLKAYLGRVKHHMLVDGDDSVVIIEASDYASLKFNVFDKMGFKTEMQVVDQLVEVEFCQAKLLPVDPPRFARDYKRVFSKMQVSNKMYDCKTVPRYVAGLGLGELAASNGVPMVDPMARKIALLSDRPIFTDDYHSRTYGEAGEALTITAEVRAAYCQAWGYSIAEQLAIERSDFTLISALLKSDNFNNNV